MNTGVECPGRSAGAAAVLLRLVQLAALQLLLVLGRQVRLLDRLLHPQHHLVQQTLHRFRHVLPCGGARFEVSESKIETLLDTD